MKSIITRFFRLIKVTIALSLAALSALGFSHARGYIEPPVVLVSEPKRERPLTEIIDEVAAEFGISSLLIEAIIRHESGYRDDASRFEAHYLPRAAKLTANKEAQRHWASSWGLMQIMGTQAPRFGLNSWSELIDVETNIRVGTQILKECIDRHRQKPKRERLRSALVCYNGSKDYPPRVFSALGEIVSERL